jgi:hypothetical protein
MDNGAAELEGSIPECGIFREVPVSGRLRPPQNGVYAGHQLPDGDGFLQDVVSDGEGAESVSLGVAIGDKDGGNVLAVPLQLLEEFEPGVSLDAGIENHQIYKMIP